MRREREAGLPGDEPPFIPACRSTVITHSALIVPMQFCDEDIVED
jgi:hypothetical protein